MRKYGKVETAFWRNPNIRALSEDARHMLLYVMTCPHSNAVGCFTLPIGYIVDDLRWDTERVTTTLSELSQKPFLKRDPGTDLILIVGWFGHNTIENPNVAKSVADSVRALPNCKLKHELIESLKQLSDCSEKVIQTLAKLSCEPFQEPFRNPEPNLTEPKPEPEPEPIRARARPAAAKEYVFEGRVIKLTQADFDTWQQSFRAIPDLVAELRVIDDKFAEDPPKKWFGKASAWLRTKHEKLLKEPPKLSLGEVVSADERRESQRQARLKAFRENGTWLNDWGPKPEDSAPPAAPQNRFLDPAEQARAHLRRWFQNGVWPSSWGPSPLQPSEALDKILAEPEFAEGKSQLRGLRQWTEKINRLLARGEWDPMDGPLPWAKDTRVPPLILTSMRAEIASAKQEHQTPVDAAISA